MLVLIAKMVGSVVLTMIKLNNLVRKIQEDFFKPYDASWYDSLSFMLGL